MIENSAILLFNEGGRRSRLAVRVAQQDFFVEQEAALVRAIDSYVSSRYFLRGELI